MQGRDSTSASCITSSLSSSPSPCARVGLGILCDPRQPTARRVEGASTAVLRGPFWNQMEEPPWGPKPGHVSRGRKKPSDFT